MQTWHETQTHNTNYYNLEVENDDGEFESKGSFQGFSAAQAAGDSIANTKHGNGYKMRITPTPTKIWRNW